MNEVQLKKMFLNIVSWSERKFEETKCGFLFTEYRKLLLSKIVIKLFEKLGSLFSVFFIFIFDNYTASLNEYHALISVLSNDALTETKKRKFHQNQ